MTNAVPALKRLGAFVLAAAVAWWIIRPNWELSGASNLGQALTDVSFWLFWLGTVIAIAGFGYAIGWIVKQKDLGLPVLITGLLLAVNGFLMTDKVAMIVFGLAIAVIGAMVYWEVVQKALEPAEA